MCLLVNPRALQFFSLVKGVSLILALPLYATPFTGQIYSVSFTDVDGHTFSTSDGHVTVVVLTTTTDSEKARIVGDRVPDYCLGNPDYRMVTVLNFKSKHTSTGHMLATMLVRHRLNQEAKRLQARYNAQNIARDARHDVFAVTDFDGTVSSQLGAQTDSGSFRVLVFGRKGELLQQWNDVPSAADLAAVVK
jgi:hypothetical protein